MNIRLGFPAAVLLLAAALAAPAGDDWATGPWTVVVTNRGTGGSPDVPVSFPGGSDTGNVLEVYYRITPAHIPLLCAFLTDGFFRQAAPGADMTTSYRVFRYWSSTDEQCDKPRARWMAVDGTNASGELVIRAAYSNDAANLTDRFRIAAEYVLEHPSAHHAALRAEMTVSNASGQAVHPYWQGHRELSEQWTLFGLSSMYVADHLTGGLPGWYDTLDPLHRYVGVTNDATFLNDGYSLNGSVYVSTHDLKYVVLPNVTVALDHDTNLCPIVYDHGHTWYHELVLQDAVADPLSIHHAYDSARSHRVELLGCSGMTTNPADLKWSVTYDRTDTNMVDGDNVQVKLGMDDVRDEWPDMSNQTVRVRLTAGITPPVLTSLSVASPSAVSLRWTTEPGARYNVQYAPAPHAAWTDLVISVSGPGLGPIAVPAGYVRIAETNTP